MIFPNLYVAEANFQVKGSLRDLIIVFIEEHYSIFQADLNLSIWKA